MSVSLIVITFFAFISYFAGRILSTKITQWQKRDQIIFVIFWAFLIGSIMLLLKWLQLNNAVGHTYDEVQGIKNAKANFMDMFVLGSYFYAVFMGILFQIGLSLSNKKIIKS